MADHFRNLVFEGGGVKGIAYIGVLEVLEEKGILSNILRVGGTSVGAINATLVALGYTNAEQKDILWNLNFKNFQDSSRWIFPNIYRVIKSLGWNKGNYFQEWIGSLIARKLDNPNATFKDLKAKNKPDLYVYGTNLCTYYSLLGSNTPPLAAHKAQTEPLYPDACVGENHYGELFQWNTLRICVSPKLSESPCLSLSSLLRCGFQA